MVHKQRKVDEILDALMEETSIQRMGLALPSRPCYSLPSPLQVGSALTTAGPTDTLSLPLRTSEHASLGYKGTTTARLGSSRAELLT
jgi:hypothetical protein